MGSTKQKTINALSWSFIDNVSNKLITFVIGIVIARMLTPAEYGLIGMTTMFFALSQIFIDSGFTDALIRKKEPTGIEYSSVFYFNIIVSILFYITFYLSAPLISDFFNEPQLILIVQVLSLNVIIHAFALVQRTILIKNVNFKLQTKISVISSLSAGLIGILLAYNGWGVWSLVWRSIFSSLAGVLLLWFWSKFRPTLQFSLLTIKEMFGFGSKLLGAWLINTIYNNVYYLIIGKFFSAKELGLYTRAEQFSALPSSNINGIIQKVSYPVLAELSDDKIKLKAAYKKLIKSTMFITFTVMLWMAAVAVPLIEVLLGDRWLESAQYLQLIVFAGMLYPLHSLNLNMLKVEGRSDLFLKLEVIKKIIAIPVIIIGIIFGIKTMLIGLIINSFIAYYLNSLYFGNSIDYPAKEQIIDLIPTFGIAMLMGLVLFTLNLIINLEPIIKLGLLTACGLVIVLSLSEIFKLNGYLEIKEVVVKKIKNYN